jgi:hypothetical protein
MNIVNKIGLRAAIQYDAMVIPKNVSLSRWEYVQLLFYMVFVSKGIPVLTDVGIVMAYRRSYYNPTERTKDWLLLWQMRWSVEPKNCNGFEAYLSWVILKVMFKI